MKPNSLEELYVEQLKDLYDAEQQIIETLPDMIDAAASDELKSALTNHLEITRTQATRLDQIFNARGEDPKGEKCKGIEGVIEEGSDLIDGIDDAAVRDAAIIAAAQRVEHYEMAGYGTARTYASLLGDDQATHLLEQTLDEEKEADQTLTALASEINVSAGGKTLERAKGKVPAKGRRKKVA
jgi:ferritin-like metal-binding protein YciE